MSATTGQRLAQARKAKYLTLDEVAHATKLRPEKILALEHDDYSQFANNAYAKGFLQIYGRYLGVDVSDSLRELENPNPVRVADYQYLNSAPTPEPERIVLRRQAAKPSLAPLIAFLVLAVVVGGVGYLYLNAQRLGNLDQPSVAGAAGGTGTTEPAPQPATAPKIEEPAPPTPPDVETEAPAPAVQAEQIQADREFIAQPAPDAPQGAATIHDVVLEPVKKTWVKVRRDDPNSTPIFEDFLYKNAPPLKLRGARFFIEVRDEGSILIRKNGAPIAWQGAAVTIQ